MKVLIRNKNCFLNGTVNVLNIFFIVSLMFLPAGLAGAYSMNYSPSSLQYPGFEEDIRRIRSYQIKSQYDSALSLANLALGGTRLSNNQKWQLLNAKAQSFYYMGDYDSLQVYVSLIEEEIGKDDPFYAQFLYTKYLSISILNNYAEGVNLLIQALALLEERQDTRTLFNVYNSLGVNYKLLGDLSPAKFYFLKAYSVFEDGQDSYAQSMVANNLGAVYNQLDLLDSAIFYYNRAVDLLSSSGNQSYLAQNHLNMGNIFEKKRDYDKAKQAFLSCLEISTKAGIQVGILLSNLNLGNLHRLMQKYEEAGPYLDEALSLARRMGVKREEGLTLERMSWLARDREDFREAYALSMEANSILDSINSEKVKKDVAELQIKYETEKVEKELAAMRIAEGRMITFIALISSGIMGLLALTFWVLYKKKKVEAEKVQLDERNHLLNQNLSLKEMELTNLAAQIIQLKKQNKAKGENDKYTSHGNHSMAHPVEDLRLLNNDFETRITNHNKDFFKQLLTIYADLSPSELTLCASLRLNLSNKEIAEIQSKSIRTIESIRLSIRKKMGLSSKENLTLYLINLNNSA